jgi:hypothetical protein
VFSWACLVWEATENSPVCSRLEILYMIVYDFQVQYCASPSYDHQVWANSVSSLYLYAYHLIASLVGICLSGKLCCTLILLYWGYVRSEWCPILKFNDSER